MLQHSQIHIDQCILTPLMKHVPNTDSTKFYNFLCKVQNINEANFLFHFYYGHLPHGNLLRKALKMRATKIEHSRWSTGHSTHM